MHSIRVFVRRTALSVVVALASSTAALAEPETQHAREFRERQEAGLQVARQIVELRNDAARLERSMATVRRVGNWTMVVGATPIALWVTGAAWVTGPAAPAIYTAAAAVAVIGVATRGVAAFNDHRARTMQRTADDLARQLQLTFGPSTSSEMMRQATDEAFLGLGNNAARGASTQTFERRPARAMPPPAPVGMPR